MQNFHLMKIFHPSILRHRSSTIILSAVGQKHLQQVVHFKYIYGFLCLYFLFFSYNSWGWFSLFKLSFYDTTGRFPSTHIYFIYWFDFSLAREAKIYTCLTRVDTSVSYSVSFAASTCNLWWICTDNIIINRYLVTYRKATSIWPQFSTRMCCLNW